MICIYFDNKFDWLDLAYGLVYPMWWHMDEYDRETKEEHDEVCVEETLQLARLKFDIDGEGDKEALGMVYCSINIWYGS